VRRHLQSDGPFHAVSLTGGEPLIWWEFLQGWLPKLKAIHPTTYLETNGTLPDALEGVLPWIDIIAMDLKLPSATADQPCWREHERFLRIAHRGAQRSCTKGSDPFVQEVFVKLTVTADTHDADLRRACDLVAAVDARTPVVLQPVTPWGTACGVPTDDQISRWQHQAKERVAGVQVIPQLQRALGVP